MTRVHVTGGYLNVETGDGGPVDPSYGVDQGGRPDNSLPGGLPAFPSHGLPQPPGVWPPLSPVLPILPAPPGTPPGVIWPTPGRPDNTLPTPPANSGTPTPPIASKVYWMIAYAPSMGWRFVSVDPSLSPGTPLPPTATPKG